MTITHEFPAQIRWTGNRGSGNRTDKGYDRTWEIVTDGKPVVRCSNDPMLGGDPALHNPEDLLITTVASCHMLWFLHLAHLKGVAVLDYRDDPVGIGESTPDGAGRFVSATLYPTITLAKGADTALADQAHAEVGAKCFIARSLNFPVHHRPRYMFAD